MSEMLFLDSRTSRSLDLGGIALPGARASAPIQRPVCDRTEQPAPRCNLAGLRRLSATRSTALPPFQPPLSELDFCFRPAAPHWRWDAATRRRTVGRSGGFTMWKSNPASLD